VEGIKNLGGELSEMMDGRISPVMEARFAQDANSLVATLSRRLRAVRPLNAHAPAATAATCSHTLSGIGTGSVHTAH
jgi:hypothetical protein